MKKIVLFCLLLFQFAGCENIEDCPDVGIPPYARFYVQFLDVNTQEDVFESGRFLSEEIEILKNNSNQEVSFHFFTEQNHLEIIVDDTSTDGQAYTILLKNSQSGEIKEIVVYFDVKTVEKRCYTNYYVENVDFPNYQYENESYSFKVKI
ncbi:hypothetical protein [Flavobacterium sp.]|uniref:hypothetical protein n=1 Tax=Flavobacterium sp. TaxID=239 RepID=UPI00352924C5